MLMLNQLFKQKISKYVLSVLLISALGGVHQIYAETEVERIRADMQRRREQRAAAEPKVASAKKSFRRDESDNKETPQEEFARKRRERASIHAEKAAKKAAQEKEEEAQKKAESINSACDRAVRLGFEKHFFDGDKKKMQKFFGSLSRGGVLSNYKAAQKSFVFMKQKLQESRDEAPDLGTELMESRIKEAGDMLEIMKDLAERENK